MLDDRVYQITPPPSPNRNNKLYLQDDVICLKWKKPKIRFKTQSRYIKYSTIHYIIMGWREGGSGGFYFYFFHVSDDERRFYIDLNFNSIWGKKLTHTYTDEQPHWPPPPQPPPVGSEKRVYEKEREREEPGGGEQESRKV